MEEEGSVLEIGIWALYMEMGFTMWLSRVSVYCNLSKCLYFFFCWNSNCLIGIEGYQTYTRRFPLSAYNNLRCFENPTVYRSCCILEKPFIHYFHVSCLFGWIMITSTMLHIVDGIVVSALPCYWMVTSLVIWCEGMVLMLKIYVLLY